MKNHKEIYSSSANAVEPTYHKMNEISHKEIFMQMKPQMIEQYNRTHFKRQEADLKAEMVVSEKEREELSSDIIRELKKRNEEKLKKQVLLE